MKKISLWLKNNYLLLLLLWFAVLLVFSYSWLPGGLDVDSCNYALVAKEALRTNTWVKLYDPTIKDIFYYHFPLYIWVTAWFFKLFGVSVLSAVLFSSLSTVALVAVIFYFGRLLANQWVGFFAGLSFLTTNHILRLGRLARMDIPVALFITAAMFCFILAQRRSRRYYLLFGLFICLAIFTKDIFGLAPLVIVAIYFVLFGRWKEFFHPWFLSGLLAVFLPLAAWVWLDQNTLFNSWYRYNFMHLYKSPSFKIPWYYYINAIAVKYFYFLPFSVYGGYLAIRRARREKQPEFYLLIIWALVFPLAFSFGRQKLHYFIIAMYPATALLVGLALDRMIGERIKPRVASVFGYALIAFATVMLCFSVDIRSRRFDEAVAMAPAIEGVLKQLPEYEFIIYKYDGAAMLWYVRSLRGFTSCKDQAQLEDFLGRTGGLPQLFYVGEKDFLQAPSALRENCRVLLKYKDRLLVVTPRDLELTITLPNE